MFRSVITLRQAGVKPDILKLFLYIALESRLQCVALAKFRINLIPKLTWIFLRPGRDEIWVDNENDAPFICAVGTGYDWMLDKPKKHPRNHIAYLRHAAFLAAPFIYLYFVPTGHILSIKSLYL